jgi:heptaprenyl diphosphate synthase
MREEEINAVQAYDAQYLRVRQLMQIAMLVCLAMALSAFERLLPISLGIPGIKLGLANLAVLTGIYLLSFRQALTLVILKCLMTAWIFGSFAAFLYSLSGTLLSFAVMSLLLYVSHFRLSVVWISIIGGVCHNIGQLLIAAAVLHSLKVFYYVPILIPAGLGAGAVIGICLRALLPQIRSKWHVS